MADFGVVPFDVPLRQSSLIADPTLLKLLDADEPTTLRRLWRHVAPSCRASCAVQIRKLFAGGTVFQNLLTLIGPDGVRRQLLVRARCDHDSRSPTLHGIALDVTDELRPRDDATDALRLQADRAVLELNHRVRNVMSVVTALIQLSGRYAEDVDTFAALTLGRIQSLNVAYSNTGIDPLAPDKLRERVDMSALAGGVLARFATETGRMQLSDTSMSLSPGQAAAVGLILFELASNAVEHGALGVPEGQVAVDWRVADRHFVIEWHESGREIADKKFEEGFGLSIIQLFARNYLNGTTSWKPRPRGLDVTIRGVTA